MYYVAYGSNIPTEEINSRCYNPKFVGSGYIEDYKLVFNYHADIEVSNGDKVPCVVYEIDDTELKGLDFYEGFPRYYGRHNVLVTLKTEYGKEFKIKALVYEMQIENKVRREPDYSYVNRIMNGYREFKLDETYLLDALKEV